MCTKVKPGDIYTCQHCGDSSVAKTYCENKKYCSRKCAGQAKHSLNMVTFDCNFCRETVTLERKTDRSAYDNFCSVSCRANSKKVAKLRVNHCEICDTSFVVKKERWGKRFCSMSCVAANKSKTVVKVTKQCKFCDASFTVAKSTITASSPRDYCSRKCSIDSRRNPEHPVLESGKHLRSNGYIGVCIDGRMTTEHQQVMREHLGRELFPHENVHHINGDKTDNRLENLELWTKSQPAGQKISDKVAHAKYLLETYSDLIPPD